MLRWSLRLHKWIALIVGVQIIGWVLGGLIMTALPIQRVRSEHHLAYPANPKIDLARVMSLADVTRAAEFDEVSEAILKATPRGPIWALTAGYGGEGWYDAYTGKNVDEIDEAAARRFALAAYQGAGKPVEAVHFDEAPTEAGTSGAVWRVTFDDAERTSFYLSAFTGELLSQRSNLWRFYNFFYEIHVMDFTGSQNYNHPTIVIAAALTLAVVTTGVVLLWIRLRRDLQSALARRRARSA